MEEIELTVTVDDKHVESTASVAEALRHEGFKVSNIVPMAGAIFGSATRDLVERLGELEGVMEVRPSHVFRVPRFNERVPQ